MDNGNHLTPAVKCDENHIWVARVSPTGIEMLDTAQVAKSISWTLPTLVGTTLYLRDKKQILALDLSKGHD